MIKPKFSFTTAVIPALSWRWTRSTMSFAEAWYAEVVQWTVPRIHVRFLKKPDVNCIPPHVAMKRRQQKRDPQICIKAFATVGADIG